MLLASFCAPVAIGRELALLDFEARQLRWIPGLPHGAAGMGLLTRSGGLVAAYTHSEDTDGLNGLVCFDRMLAPVRSYNLKSVRQAHSVVAYQNGLLINSSGSDSLVFVRLLPDEQISEQLFWRLGDGGHAQHVNSVLIQDDTVLVTMFGPRRDGGWFQSAGGCVWDVMRDRPICEGLAHPHTLFLHEGTPWVMESFTGRVLQLGTSGVVERFRVSGYTRGAALHEEWLYIATSYVRMKSKHTGKRRAAHEKIRSVCAIHRIHLPSGRKETWDLRYLAREIYDLLWLA